MRNKMLRRKEAVSPVIATILMVAITVVLAATLYMMLPDDTGGAGSQQSGSFSGTGDEMLSEEEYKVEFAKFSPERKISDLRFNLKTPGNDTALADRFDGDVTGATATFENLDYQLNYSDQTDNKVVNSGDYLVVYNPNGLASGQYEMTVLYEGDQVDSITWDV